MPFKKTTPKAKAKAAPKATPKAVPAAAPKPAPKPPADEFKKKYNALVRSLKNELAYWQTRQAQEGSEGANMAVNVLNKVMP